MRWPERAPVVAGRVAAAAAPIVMPWVTPALVLAATPTPDAVGDPRSAGEGPGLVGDPLMAILIVAAIAVLALAATLAYVRATGGPERRPPS